MNLTDRSNKYWSGRAPEFSKLRMNDYDTDMRMAYEKFLLAFLPKDKEKTKVLDIGTGAGFFAIILRSFGYNVTAVDFSEDMLKEAKKNSFEKGFNDINFIQMDAQNLKFDDNSFDFIITRNVTWIVEDAFKVYFHIHRVLKPGGVMVNIDANYGKVFEEADKRGEEPVHPTQSLKQLRERNDIAKSCNISKENRPEWDVEVLLSLGISEFQVLNDIDEKLGIANLNNLYTSASNKTKAKMFAVAAKK